MKNLFLILLIVFTSCVSGQKKNPNDKTETGSSENTVKESSSSENIIVGSGTTNIALNESITMEDVTITFTEIIEDSRCPSDATCIWAGRAKVAVTVSEKGKAKQKRVITFDPTDENSNKSLYEGNEFSIMATALNPYPTSENGEKRDYVLEVKKANITLE